jgi:ribosomal protein S27E
VSATHDLVTVRCEKCGKYQLAEGTARGTAVPCLICKKPLPIPAASPVPTPANDDELLGLT